MPELMQKTKQPETQAAKNQACLEIASTLEKLIEKCSAPKIDSYFKNRMPLSSTLNIVELETVVANLVKRAKDNEGRLNEYFNTLRVKTKEEMATPEQSERNVDAVIKARITAQGIEYAYLEHMQKNFGLVFVPQRYADETKGQGIMAAKYSYHTEPVGVGLNCDDTVRFMFGVPFLPLIRAERREYIPEKKAIIAGFRSLAEALKGWAKHAEHMAQYYDNENKDIGNELKEHTYNFYERLDSYADLLLPVSRCFWDYGTGGYEDRLGDRDWSLPTFRFDLPLKEKLEELLEMRGKELSPELVGDIKLTLKVLDTRRKLIESYREYSKGTGSNSGLLAWNSLEEANLSVEETLIITSLALLDHPRALELAKNLNNAGIEEIIGYKLPEK